MIKDVKNLNFIFDFLWFLIENFQVVLVEKVGRMKNA